jgi:hypothetical protein
VGEVGEVGELGEPEELGKFSELELVLNNPESFDD